MIDYFSLALGHGLLAVALLRLVMREDLDVDPRAKAAKEGAEAARMAATHSARASRQSKVQDSDAGPQTEEESLR